MNNFIYEGMVKYKGEDVKITLTRDFICILKEKGLFVKKFREVDSIPVTYIKIVKDKVQVKKDKNVVTIKTVQNDYVFTCERAKDARKLVDDIIYARTGKTITDRVTIFTKNFVGKTVKLVGIAGTVAIGTREVIKKMIEIKENLKK